MPLIPRTPEAALIALALAVLPACSGNVERVPVTEFTEGVQTEVVEVAPDEWRIADEQVVPDTSDSRVIAKGLDGVVDTFALAELNADAAVPASDSTSYRRQHRSGLFTGILLYGLIGNRMGGYRNGFSPRASAYVTPQAYNRVQNGAGSRLNRTGRQRSVARPGSGSRGFGGGRSGRSFGG